MIINKMEGGKSKGRNDRSCVNVSINGVFGDPGQTRQNTARSMGKVPTRKSRQESNQKVVTTMATCQHCHCYRRISNLIVIDADSQQGQKAINEFIPDTLEFPTAKTPRGWHNHFEYQAGLRSGPSGLTDCDIKTDGGYVIVPPSKNGNGDHYKWIEGLKLYDVNPAAIPETLLDALQSVAAGYASASSASIKRDVSLYNKR